MENVPLTLVVCAAPLAERAGEVAGTLIRSGWNVSVVATPASAAWVDHEAVRRMIGRSVAMDYRRPDEPRRGPRRGCPFYAQKPGRMDVMGKRVQVKPEYLKNCVASVQKLVDEL